ncbi:MAG: hypothetical protein JXB03_00555 [Spirochaetales bacterium]|nr:hypothetical protein [Spirochaetales bacterium]
MRERTLYRNISRNYRAAFLAVMIAVSPYVFAETGNHDRDLADAYVSTFLKDDFTSADLHLLDVALEFYPRHGDALYLMGKHPSVARQTGVAYLEKALVADYWLMFTLNDAAVELFSAYIQLKKYSQAGVLLGGYELDFFDTPDHAELLAHYYEAVGDRERLIKVVESGYSRWYERFVPYKIKLDSEFRELLFKRIGQFSEFNPGTEALQSLFPFADEEMQTILVNRYAVSGSFSPGLHAHGLRLGIFDPASLKDIASYGTVISGILNYGMEDPLLGEYADQVYAEYNGKVYFDEDEDSFHEETLVFHDGVLRSHVFDNDQDGEADVIISYSVERAPVTVEIRDGDDVWEVSYSQYPYVDRVSSVKPVSAVYIFDQAVLDVITLPAKPYIPADVSVLNSRVLSEFCGAHSIAKEQEEGLPYDSVSTGSFSLDTDNNGIVEYSLFLEEGFKEEQWDIDQDGDAEIIQTYDDAAGIATLSIFDYEVVLVDDIPVSLKYQGKEKKLTIEGPLVWIDTEPVDAMTEPFSTGYMIIDGTSYYSYRFHDYLFIQQLGN